jgi:cell division protein FtsB
LSASQSSGTIREISPNISIAMSGRSKFLDPSNIPLKQRARENIWEFLTHITKGLILLGVLAMIAVCFLPVIRRLHRLREDRTTNESKIQAAEVENVRLGQEVQLLKTSPDYIERQARDRLNVARPDELIFRFDPYPPSSTAAASAFPAPVDIAKTPSSR